ncbi:MAG: hypothetical protein ACXQTS_02485, partial [Candidatus Methanospirareceae archaeon]
LMIKSKTLAKIFLLGAIEINNTLGAKVLYEWLRSIGERLGEIEGKGIEGRKSGELHYMPICPFVTLLESIHYREVLPREGDKYAMLPRDKDVNGPACADIICIMHHAYRRKRAELAGKRVFHLAARSPLTGEVVFNEEAMKEVGKDKKEVEELLKRAACVFLYKDELEKSG